MVGGWLDWMILEVFSNLEILRFYDSIFLSTEIPILDIYVGRLVFGLNTVSTPFSADWERTGQVPIAYLFQTLVSF